MTTSLNQISIFLSYAREDEAWVKKLEKHLSLLKRQGVISTWYDREIIPGTNRVNVIDQHLEQASIILLFVSADFLASDACYNVEMTRALQRHEAGTARVIPLIIRPTDWTTAPFAHLSPLPTDAKAITAWSNKDEAFVDVVSGLRHAIEDLSLLPASPSHVVLPSIWNIPYPHNPFFIGRDEVLENMHTQLQKGQPTALSQSPYAISGLGGIGKTQIAIEYAYRYRQDYQTVLWVRAESTDALNSSYNELATLLNLFQKDTQEQEIVVQAVKTWLRSHQKWLLILDNADKPELLSPFLPLATDGHILLTTRATDLGSLGLAHPIQIKPFLSEEGSLFLLYRSGLLALDKPLNHATLQDQDAAKQIVREMGGLPLALDLAAAFIAATVRSLIEYLDIYQQYRADLLKQRRNRDYSESVATTWNISFEQVKIKNPAAVELMQLCACLAPYAIPEIILTKGAVYLGPILSLVITDTFLLAQIIETLYAYSLLERDPQSHSFFIHPLIQAVVFDSMETDLAREWKKRAILAVNEVVTPNMLEMKNWNMCEQWLPHALLCATWTEQEHFASEESASLVNRTALYLETRGRYNIAKPLFVQALAIREQQLGPKHPQIAISLSNLAQVYRNLGKRDLARMQFYQAFRIFERKSRVDDINKILKRILTLIKNPSKVLIWRSRPEDYQMVYALNNFAGLCVEEKEYELAEKLYMSALMIYGQLLRPSNLPWDQIYIPADNDIFFAQVMNNMGELCRIQGEYDNAEAMYKAALETYEEAVGSKHYMTSNSLNNLAITYLAQKKYEEAESLCIQALAIREQQLGWDHSRTIETLHNLVAIYTSQGKFEQAEPLWRRQLEIYEKSLGLEHPKTANILSNLAAYYRDQGKYEKAEALYTRQLVIYEQMLGPEHLYTAISRNNLARLFLMQGKYEKAQTFFALVLKIFEQQLGAEHVNTAGILNNLGLVYMAQGELKQAESFYLRALAIKEHQLGLQHSDTQLVQRNYAVLLKMAGHEEEVKRPEEML